MWHVTDKHTNGALQSYGIHRTYAETALVSRKGKDEIALASQNSMASQNRMRHERSESVPEQRIILLMISVISN